MKQEELIDTYTEFSDDQLLEAYHNADDYTIDAKSAMSLVIEKRGGIDTLLAKRESRAAFIAESVRIRQEVMRLAGPDVTIDFLLKMIHSQILDENDRQAVIQNAFTEAAKERDDVKIKPRTIIGGGLAAVMASLIGGILWGLQLMWSGRMFLILLVGLALLCYAVISLVTKQTHKNKAVLLLSVISVVAALVIGQLMYMVFGRQ